ncbi:unnamed protein product, partial [Closterium sp. NIES-64]
VEARLEPPWTLSLEHATSERLGGGEIASYSFDVLKEAADVAVERLVIRQCGLLLPRVSIGSPSLLFIQQGSGVVELIDDNGQAPADVSPITVNRGDAVVVPKGWTYILPSLPVQKSYLAGSNPHSVLSGFSLHILETAFNQQHDVVRALLHQASGGGIIVSRCVPPSPPEPAAQEDVAEEDGDKSEEDGSVGDGSEGGVSEGICIEGEIVLLTLYPHAVVAPHIHGNAAVVFTHAVVAPHIHGNAAVVFTVLQGSGHFESVHPNGTTAASDAHAVVAPHIHGNAAVVFTVLKGSGHFESVHPNGTTAASDAVQTGHVGVVPMGYAHALQAGEQGVQILGVRIGSYHPSIKFLAVPPGREQDPGAEDKFKEISTAYEVLSDDEKRPLYDRFGEAGVSGSGGMGGAGAYTSNPFDLFESIFGRVWALPRGEAWAEWAAWAAWAALARGTRQPVPATIMEMPLEFREVIFGAEKTINVAHLDGCNECGGSGAKAGTSPRTCPTCRGMGQVMQTRQTAFGMFSSVSTCSTCAGVGEVISEFCRKCGGEGRVRTRKPVVINVPAGVDSAQCCASKGRATLACAVVINVPAGVDSGTVLRVKGEGDAGMRGALAPPLLPAALAPCKPVVINVLAGVDSGTVLHVKGEGDAGMCGGKRGDLYVFVKVKETMGIRRDGINLYSNVSIDYTDAILGTVAKVGVVSKVGACTSGVWSLSLAAAAGGIRRDGINLYSNVSIDYTDAILGTLAKVDAVGRLDALTKVGAAAAAATAAIIPPLIPPLPPSHVSLSPLVATVDGAAELSVPGGTQPGDTLVLDCKGVPTVVLSQLLLPLSTHTITQSSPVSLQVATVDGAAELRVKGGTQPGDTLVLECKVVPKVATVDGAAELRVPAGTQPGDTLVLERKGVPKVGKSNIRGDHFFQVNVSIPKRVSPTERDLVEELASIHKTGKTRTGITVEGASEFPLLAWAAVFILQLGRGWGPRGSSSSSGVDGEGIVDTVNGPKRVIQTIQSEARRFTEETIQPFISPATPITWRHVANAAVLAAVLALAMAVAAAAARAAWAWLKGRFRLTP